MTPIVMKFAAEFGNDGRVLEVGSFDVNGSLRNYYPNYVGIDVRPGAGVDIVYARAIPFEDAAFDKVLYLEAMEHDALFWLTFAEMVRVLKPAGRLIATTRMFNYPRHDMPHDYYRFTADALLQVLAHAGLEHVSAHENMADGGVFASGVKP